MQEHDAERGLKISLADDAVLTRIMMRRKQRDKVREGVDLGRVLTEIVSWAERFVPSHSGSVLLDDPVLKLQGEDDKLFFAACFGESASMLVGTGISAFEGIAGRAYRTGEPYISEDVATDESFLNSVDRKTSYETRSIICAPISIQGAVIGVIELVNRRDKASYTRDDLKLLEIFAGYTANLVENSLVAREFEELSKMDNLTGLFNDRFFFVSLEREVERVTKSGGDTSLIFFDLDSFKEVNDTHGHLAGSTVLKEVADLVREVFKGTTAISARYGGDEFVVIMPQTQVRLAADYAERLREAIEHNVFLTRSVRPDEAPIRLSGRITASVGVASQRVNVMPRGDARFRAEALLRAADNAMYLAKEIGRNRVFTAAG